MSREGCVSIERSTRGLGETSTGGVGDLIAYKERQKEIGRANMSFWVLDLKS